MANVRTIHVDWYNQRPLRFIDGPQLAYQGDHLSNMVVFDNAPSLPNYYLLVEMKTDDEGPIIALPAIQLEGPYWVIPNYYTQICQTITYQVCCKTGTNDFERHSAKFKGTILPVITHNGEPIDQSTMFDPYIDILDKRVDKLIVASGDIQIDSELKSDSTNPVQNKAVKAAIDGFGEDIAGVNGRLTQQAADTKNHLGEISALVEPDNKYNPATSEIGALRLADGTVVPSYTNITTSDYISIEPNDIVYMCGVGASDNYLYGTGTINVLCWYDANKIFIGGTYNTNGYAITAENAAYIRFSFVNTGAFGTAMIISLTLNHLPATAAGVTEYFDTHYKNAYTKAEQADAKAQRALDLVGADVNDKIIDCWGDSRTEMVAAQGTSFCDYLNTLLGSAYQVTNYGISSQASGMCAARLGSNEIFVTFENNRINASGASNITAIYVSSGLINNYFCYSTAGGMPCTIKGVRGTIYKTVYNNCTSCAFVRDVDGSQLSVYPRTKVNAENENSKNHACIFWWGKNDMLTAAEGRSAIKTIYDDAVKYIGHDRFIILGETCSLSSQYEQGQVLRTFLDNFNAQMAAAYPNNFIDINAWLSSEDALTSVGLTPTAEDTANIAKGWPCYQLMVYSTDSTDSVHPNAKGREAIANRIYAWMQEHDWI